VQIVIIMGSTDEVTEVLQRFPELRGNVGGNGALPAARPITSATTKTASYWTDKAVRDLLTLVWGKQKQLLRFLMKGKGAASYRDVMAHFKFKKGQQLSGILSGLTRNARKTTGFKDAKIIQWRRRNDTDSDGEYYIHPDAYDMLTMLAQDL